MDGLIDADAIGDLIGMESSRNSQRRIVVVSGMFITFSLDRGKLLVVNIGFDKMGWDGMRFDE